MFMALPDKMIFIPGADTDGFAPGIAHDHVRDLQFFDFSSKGEMGRRKNVADDTADHPLVPQRSKFADLFFFTAEKDQQ